MSTDAIASRVVLVAAGVLVTSAVAFSPAAEARDHGKHQKHHDRTRSHRDDRNHDYRFVDVPRHMHAHHRHEFRHAYAGRTYYGPHRHHHVIYRYPVVVGGVVTYRPYSYCNDELWVTGYAPLPRVVIGFNVRPGIHIHAGAY